MAEKIKYVTAKTYSSAKWIGEPFQENGRMYVNIEESCGRCDGSGRISYYGHIEGGLCFKCGGLGKWSKQVRVYTEAYMAAQEAAKEKAEAKKVELLMANSEKNKAEWCEKHNIGADGMIWIVVGEDTYAIKDALKEMGCRFDPVLRWHSATALEMPEGYSMVSVSFDEVYEWNALNKTAYMREEAKQIVDRRVAEAEGPSLSDYVEGEIGDRIRNLTAVYTGCRGFQGRFGWTNIYSFKHGENVLVWFTSSEQTLEKGQIVDFTGTIKSFEEYRGVKTTQFSRCSIKVIG